MSVVGVVFGTTVCEELSSSAGPGAVAAFMGDGAGTIEASMGDGDGAKGTGGGGGGKIAKLSPGATIGMLIWIIERLYGLWYTVETYSAFKGEFFTSDPK